MVSVKVKAIRAQAEFIDVLEGGFQLPSTGQGTALLVHVFLDVGVQGLERLPAPAQGPANALAQEVGAVLSYMDHQWNYSTAIPDPRYPGTDRGLFARFPLALWGNVEGKRFVNESESYKVTFPAVVNQETSSFWAVFDQEG